MCSDLIVFAVFVHLVALRFDRLNSSLVKLALHIVLDSGTVILESNEKKLCEFPQNIMQAFTKKTIEQSYCLRLFPRQESIVKSLENEKLNPHLQYVTNLFNFFLMSVGAPICNSAHVCVTMSVFGKMTHLIFLCQSCSIQTTD